jgi:hypothetical protein
LEELDARFNYREPQWFTSRLVRENGEHEAVLARSAGKLLAVYIRRSCAGVSCAAIADKFTEAHRWAVNSGLGTSKTVASILEEEKACSTEEALLPPRVLR